jgi:hypothetical protein
MSKVLTTPKGTAVYPRIDNPDTKFNEDGVYSCKLHVDEASFNAFTKQVTDIVEREYEAECTVKGKKLKKAATTPIRITPDGDFEIYAKQVAQRQTKKGLLTFTIPVFDSKGAKLPTSPAIGSGSTLKLSVEVYTWYTDLQGFGYTLRMKAVQLLDLIEYNNGSGSSYGFTEEENGYINDGESLDTAFQEEEPAQASGVNF